MKAIGERRGPLMVLALTGAIAVGVVGVVLASLRPFDRGGEMAQVVRQPALDVHTPSEVEAGTRPVSELADVVGDEKAEFFADVVPADTHALPVSALPMGQHLTRGAGIATYYFVNFSVREVPYTVLCLRNRDVEPCTAGAPTYHGVLDAEQIAAYPMDDPKPTDELTVVVHLHEDYRRSGMPAATGYSVGTAPNGSLARDSVEPSQGSHPTSLRCGVPDIVLDDLGGKLFVGGCDSNVAWRLLLFGDDGRYVDLGLLNWDSPENAVVELPSSFLTENRVLQAATVGPSYYSEETATVVEWSVWRRGLG